MDLRITPQTTLENALAAVAEQTMQLGKLQQQASTGKKILLPSDDPTDIGQLLSSKAQDARLGMYLTNIQSSTSTLNTSVSTLQDASSVLADARTIAVEASQSTNTPQAMQAMGQQVDQLLQRLVNLANTQENGHYLYGGAANTKAPFTVTTDATGEIQSVAYQGAEQRDGVPVGPGQTVTTLYSGRQIFQTGGNDAFQTLVNLRDDLFNKAGLSDTDQIHAINGRIAELHDRRNNVLSAVGEQSATLQHLENLLNHVQDVQLTNKTIISNLEDADLSDVALKLQSYQNLFQMTLASTTRLMGQSLLDFLH